MAGDPVAYAEGTLGVHDVWDECQSRMADHADAKERYLLAGKAVRELKASVAEREAVVTSDERGKHPDMKITEFKQHLSTVLEQDTVMSGYRDELADQETFRAEAEQDMRHHELGVRALTARMHELAGLLEFYGAAKRSNNRTG